MNTQDFLTYLFNALACGYAALIILDLGNYLGGGLLDIFASSPAALPLIIDPATPVDLPSLHPVDEGVLISLTPLEVVAEERVSSLSIPLEAVAEERVLLLLIPLEAVADPWSAEEEPNLSQHPCCCHTVIAPQLLLPPGLFGNADQPDLATLPNTELRKRCQSAGIKWRNAHGTNKHLSKNQMITALG